MSIKNNSRKLIAFFVICQMIIMGLPALVQADPIIAISNADELMGFAVLAQSGTDAKAELWADIVLGADMTPIGLNADKPFNGEFNGNGYSITFTSPVNATFDKTVYSCLFGYIGQNGTVKNLKLCGAQNSENSIAALAYCNNGDITNVSSSATLTSARFVSAFVYTNKGNIHSCENSGKLTTQYGEIYAFARDNYGSITNSKNKGEISGAEFYNQELFALSASAFVNSNKGDIRSCENSAKVSGGQNVSGFAASNEGMIDGCVNGGDIYAYSQYGAGIANTNAGIISSSENSGNVYANANYTAGIADKSNSGEITGCRNFGTITGDSQVAGIVSETKATVRDCRNYGSILCIAPDPANQRKKYFAGIAGMTTAEIKECVNYGEVNGGCMYTGGITGYANGSFEIVTCGNYGTVNSAAHRVGGIAGQTGAGVTIRECESMGGVHGALSGTGNYAGSITSYNAGTITDCISKCEVTGLNTVGGLIARNYSTEPIAVSNCLMMGDNCKLNAQNNPAGFENIYVTSACTGGTLVTPEEFADGTVITLFNTKNYTVEDRGIFSGTQIYGIPVGVLWPEETDPPAEQDPAAASDIVVSAAKNEGISKDIYAVFLSPAAYIFLPSTYLGDTVNIDIINKSGETVSDMTINTAQSDSAAGIVSLQSGDYEIKVIKSDLPAFYMDIDETYGRTDVMNTSDKHVDYCYGDFSLDMPEELAQSRGWSTHYESINDPKSDTPGSMSVRGRGNSSWKIQTNKKPSYQLKSEKKVDLLGMGKSKKWVLVANDYDLFKNKFGLDLGKNMGIKYTNDSEFVDLYLNGAYMGVYMLSEKVEIASNRINITDMDEEIEAAGAENIDTVDKTGGYLVEIDNAADATEAFTVQGNSVSVKSPEDLDTKVTADNRYSYIVNLITDMFNAVYDSDDLLMQDGTSLLDKIDIESFVRYFWHQEFLENTDCGRGSTYFYKDKDSIDPKIYAGPVWDTDALSYYYRTGTWWMPQSTYSASKPDSAPSFYRKLIEHKEFISYVMWYYENSSDIKEAMEGAADLIRSYKEQLSVAGPMNSIRWNFGAEFNIDKFITSAETRASWVEENYGELAELASKGEFIEIKEPEEEEEPGIIAKLILKDGTAGAEIEESEDNFYDGFKGAKALKTTLAGSVNGAALSDIVYSDSAYKSGEENLFVPILAASAECGWGEAPYFEIITDTLGYKNVTFSAKLGGSKKGPKNFKLLYSTDGINFAAAAEYAINTNKTMEQAFDSVALPGDAFGQSKLYIRIEAVDRTTISGGSTGDAPASGEIAINDIIISGELKESMISELKTGENVSALFTNTTDASLEASVILVCYKDGRVTDVSIVNTPALDPAAQHELIFGAADKEFDTAKVYVFEGIGTMHPLCDVYDYEAEQ
ncbi:MAG: CotH kinase family protein [Clostridia bacterium]|nr:CotH kinase family protein [Clostridia bacterium]